MRCSRADRPVEQQLRVNEGDMMQAVRPPKQDVSSVRLFESVSQKQGFKTVQDSKQFLKRVSGVLILR